MKQIFHILKYKFIAYVKFENRFQLYGLTNVIKDISSFLVYAGFGIGSFFFTKSIIKFLLVDIKVGLFLLHQFIAMVLFIFFVAVNIGNIIVAHSTLFKSSDVTFLMAKPVKPSQIFLIKFLDNFFYSSSTLFIVIISVLAGYASYFHIATGLFLVLIIFNFLPFILTAGTLGVLILLLIVRLSAKFGVKKVIYFLVFLYLALLLMFFNLNSPVKLVNSVMHFYPFIDKDKFLVNLLPSFTSYLPSQWLSEAAYFISTGKFSESIPFIIYQISLSAGLFLFTYFIGKRWYFYTWLLNISLSNRRRIKKNQTGIISFQKQSILKPQVEALLKRDFLLFFREPVQVIHLLVLLVLISIFISSVSEIKFIGQGNFYLQTSIYLSFFLFNMLLISTLSLRFVFPSLSLEGMSYWKIKSSPVGEVSLFLLKMIPPLIVLMIISSSLGIITNLSFGFEFGLINVVITFISSIAIFAINFGMGGIFVNHKEKSAIRIASSQGASITFLFNIFYMLFIIIFLFDPVSSYFFSLTVNKPFNVHIFYVPLIIIITMSLLIIYVFSKFGYYALSKDF